MFKRLILLLLEFGAGLAGNLLAAAIQQDAWDNLFTPTRLAATVGGAAIGLLLLALLESERSLAWNWRWHRYWYLRGLARNPDLHRWQVDFARLKLVSGRQAVVTAELLADGERRDMVMLLQEFVLRRQAESRAVLVLGEPGAGKTTGLERLTWELARQGARRLGWNWPVPVLLPLGRYQEGSLTDFAAQQMRTAVGGRSGKVLSQGLETLLEAGRIVLLCDALDEALGARRDLVLAEIDRLLRSQAYAAVRLALTARTREEPGSKLRDLPVFTIQDLSDEAVAVFVRVYRQEGHDEADVLARLRKFGLLEPGGLGRNPFWLKLVVQSGAFQGRKGQILRQAVADLLAREWQKP
ncbi:MAG: NACHT domain-containing protein, partial [Ardenticatenales bacterium]|nr:NACHT domain-containing protein [Ardenticatenales bacterium]